MKKRGQSEIITTVLIILLVLAAVVIVWQVVKTTVTNSTKNIESSTACLDAIDELTIDKTSCYIDIGGGNMEVTVKVNRGMKNIDINNFIILITNQTDSQKFEIKNGSSPGAVRMIIDFTADLETPQPGENKKYSITTTLTSNIDSLQIAPIINDKLCNPSEKVKINACTS